MPVPPRAAARANACALLALAAAACADRNPEFWDSLEGGATTLRAHLGVASHMYQGPDASPTRDYEIARYVELGGIRVREHVKWNHVEPADDEWRFEAVATQIGRFRQTGLAMTALLKPYGTFWASPTEKTSDIDPAEYGEYAGAVARRFCDDVHDYEIWNEQNHYWSPAPDPDHYGKLLKAAYAAIKAACPGARVLYGGLASFDFTRLLDRWWFVSAVHAAHPDICRHFDAMAAHPYTYMQSTPPESDSVFFGEQFAGQSGMTALLRDRMRDMGCEGKPIIYTEVGWPSYELTEEQQALFLARSLLLSVRDGVEAWYWYTFWDEEPITEGARPHGNYFGLFGWPGADGTARRTKPAYLALKGAADVLGDLRYAGDLSATLGLPNDVHALAFAGGGALGVALWDGRDFPDGEGSTPNPDTRHPLVLGLPEGTTSVVLHDREGRETLRRDGDEPLELVLAPSVQYLRIER